MHHIKTIEQISSNLNLDEDMLHDLMKSEPIVIKAFIEKHGYKISRHTLLKIRDLYWYDQPRYQAVKQMIIISFELDLSRSANMRMAGLLMKAKLEDWWRLVTLKD